MNDRISAYFAGSPGAGFSTFPKDRIRLLEKYDNRNEAFNGVLAKQEVKNGSGICYYINYNIFGAPKSSRGGRNFGIWINMAGMAVSSEFTHELYDFLQEVFQDGVLRNSQVDVLREENDRVTYAIDKFEERHTQLEGLSEKVTENFIKIFSDKLIEVGPNEKYQNELNPTKLKEDKRRQEEKNRRAKQQHTGPIELSVQSSRGSTVFNRMTKEDEKRGRVFLLPITLALVFSVCALILSLLSLGKSNHNEEKLIKIEADIKKKPSSSKQETTKEQDTSTKVVDADVKRPTYVGYTSQDKNSMVMLYLRKHDFMNFVRDYRIRASNKQDLIDEIAKFVKEHPGEITRELPSSKELSVFILENNPKDGRRMDAYFSQNNPANERLEIAEHPELIGNRILIYQLVK